MNSLFIATLLIGAGIAILVAVALWDYFADDTPASHPDEHP